MRLTYNQWDAPGAKLPLRPVTFLAFWVMLAEPQGDGASTYVVLMNGYSYRLDVPFETFNRDLDFQLAGGQ